MLVGPIEVGLSAGLGFGSVMAADDVPLTDAGDVLEVADAEFVAAFDDDDSGSGGAFVVSGGDFVAHVDQSTPRCVDLSTDSFLRLCR